MAKDPAFLFYSQDFIVGVQIMNFEDRGKYITLLAQMHQQGRLDEETIRFLIGNVSDKLKAKFQIDEKGMWFNERLENEMEKRSAFVDSRRKNGQLGGRPKKASKEPIGKPNNKPIGKPNNNLYEDENEDENLYRKFILLFNSIKNSKYRGNEKIKRQFKARIIDGYNLEDFGKAIKNCKKDQFHIENTKYLTPEFITRADKLETYLNVEKNEQTKSKYPAL